MYFVIIFVQLVIIFVQLVPTFCALGGKILCHHDGGGGIGGGACQNGELSAT